MPLIQIQVVEGRKAEDLQNLIKEVTNTVVHTLHVKHQQVRVIVTEIPSSHWG